MTPAAPTLLQVAVAMERSGVVADKERIRGLYERLHVSEEEEREILYGAEKQRRKSPGTGKELDRFKFWLGLPNNFYESDWP